jgi:peptidoglycan-associated lipoprotein
MMIAPRALATLALVAVATAACRKQPEPAAEPETVPVATVDSTDIRAQAERDRLERERIERERLAAERERALAEARNALAAAVYFDYDQAALSDNARSTLEAKVPVLQSNSSLRLRIAGHTDSRGSDEYNMALGNRRAAAVQQYLVDRGIDASRLQIVSFGEEMPAAQGEDESAWSQNRRAEFTVTSGSIGTEE